MLREPMPFVCMAYSAEESPQQSELSMLLSFLLLLKVDQLVIRTVLIFH